MVKGASPRAASDRARAVVERDHAEARRERVHLSARSTSRLAVAVQQDERLAGSLLTVVQVDVHAGSFSFAGRLPFYSLASCGTSPAHAAATGRNRIAVDANTAPMTISSSLVAGGKGHARSSPPGLMRSALHAAMHRKALQDWSWGAVLRPNRDCPSLARGCAYTFRARYHLKNDGRGAHRCPRTQHHCRGRKPTALRIDRIRAQELDQHRIHPRGRHVQRAARSWWARHWGWGSRSARGRWPRSWDSASSWRTCASCPCRPPTWGLPTASLAAPALGAHRRALPRVAHRGRRHHRLGSGVQTAVCGASLALMLADVFGLAVPVWACFERRSAPSCWRRRS